jgi:hypothetical protein
MDELVGSRITNLPVSFSYAFSPNPAIPIKPENTTPLATDVAATL